MTICTSSPPPTSSHNLENRLDAQLLHLRAEITKLRSQKQKLSTSLLGSSKIQRQLSTHRVAGRIQSALADRLDAFLEKQRRDEQVRVHKLAFGVTAFPVEDTAPETQSGYMLGARIDLHPTTQELLNSQETTRKGGAEQDHDGRHEEDEEHTHYVLLFRKLRHAEHTYLKLHQHNVPKHIDVEAYERMYLSLPDALHTNDEGMRIDQIVAAPALDGDSFQAEDDSGIDVTELADTSTTDGALTNSPITGHAAPTNIKGNNQDLHKFISQVHDDLQAWHNRVQSIVYLQHTLGSARYGVKTVERVTNDARQLRLVWVDGTIGLLKIGYDGFVERAVAYGTRDGGDGGSESELSELESDDDRNVRRPARSQAMNKVSEHVRMHNVEKKLMRTDGGEKVRVQELGKVLQRIFELKEIRD